MPLAPLFPRPLLLLGLLLLGCLSIVTHAADLKDAEAAALRLVPDQEREGYEFRADLWSNTLEARMGRAVRVQLFKGNEYAFCIAVPRDSGARISAVVLDFEGKPAGEVLPVADGWGLVLFYKPKKTGTYAIAIRQTGTQPGKAGPCAFVTGWK